MGSRVAVLAPQTGRLVGSIPTGIGPVHIAFTPDGHRAYVSNYLSSNVAVVDVRTRRVLRRVAVGMWPHGLAVTPDGRQVWVPCGGAASLSVIATHTDRVTRTYIAGLMPHAVAFAPDRRTVYMTDAGRGDLVVLDRASGAVRARVPIHRIWAPFSFRSPYHAHAAIRLTEDRAQLRRVLPSDAMHQAWRWDFGDRTHATGWTVAHRYAHPGTYRITVSAYYPVFHQYFTMDTVRVRITR